MSDWPFIRLRRAGAVSTVTALSLLGIAGPADAASANDYAALGDSYASGVGAGSYINDGTDCLRSTKSYPGQVTTTKTLNLSLQACSGALTSDVMSRQLGTLSGETDVVTITVGGNDIGFANVLSECAKPSWMANCTAAVNAAVATMNNELPAKLDRTYRAVKAGAPNAKVIVTGYPRLFNGQDCSLWTFFSGDEMTRLNNAANTLNARLSERAAAAHATFVNVTTRFNGHAVCDRSPWLHNVSVTTPVQSFHPNLAGHTEYATAVGPNVPSTATTGPSSIRTGGTTSSDTRRGQVRVPNLRSAEARAASRKAGIADADLDLLAAAQERGASNAQLNALEEQVVRRATK